MNERRHPYRRESEENKEVSVRKNKRLPLEASIARLVCLAQDASDSGKYEQVLNFRNTNNAVARKHGYSVKTSYIMKAIKIINSNPRCGWNYYISGQTPDQNRYPSVIVYFEYKDDGNRYQVSFHTPWSLVPDNMTAQMTKGRQTRWNHQIGGSRRDCQRLIKRFDL